MRIREVVFDTSAMLAVFNAKSTPYAVWTVADQTDSDVRVAVPVGAMLDAAQALDIRSSAWDAVLWSPKVRVLPLSEVVAKDIGNKPVRWARATRCGRPSSCAG